MIGPLPHVLVLCLLGLLAPQDAEPTAPVVLSGGFVLPGGDPASGVQLELEVFRRTTGEQQHLSTVTDAEGRFDLTVAPGDEFFHLEARLAEHAVVRWNWSELQPGELVDLGTVPLARAGTVVGRIVDADGEFPGGTWRVGLRRLGQRGGWPPPDHVMADPRSGVFRLESLHPGLVTVSAMSQHADHTDRIELRVVADREVEALLAYGGPDPDASISVEVFDIYPFMFASSTVRLVDEDGTVRVAGRGRHPKFDDLPDGVYRLVIDDPHYQLWSRDGIRPGEDLQAVLEGGASLRVEVVDEQTGAPVMHYSLAVAYDASERPHEEPLISGDEPAPTDGVVMGLVCAPLTLVARAPGRPDTRVHVAVLVRGEVTPVRIAIPPARETVGRVLDVDGGTPIAGALVEWIRGPELVRRVPSYWAEDTTVEETVPAEEVLTTGPDGRFRLTRAEDGVHHLRVHWTPWLSEEFRIEIPQPPGEELSFVAPPHGWVEGRLRLPEVLDGIEVELHASQDRSTVDMGPQQTTVELEPDGTFRAGPFGPGEASFELALRQYDGQSERHMSHSLGSVEIRAGETATVAFDARKELRGCISARVTLNGRPFVGGRVRLWKPEHSRDEHLVDDAGRALLTLVRPGTRRLAVWSSDRRWVWCAPHPVEVLPGRCTEVVLEVGLRERAVRFVDSKSGESMVEARVGWKMGCGSDMLTDSATTDATGQIVLTLPDGDVRFYAIDRPASFAPPVSVDWGEGDGEVVVKLATPH